MKAEAVCAHCGERREMEDLSKATVPLVCNRCGQVMMLSTPEVTPGKGSEVEGSPPTPGQQQDAAQHPPSYAPNYYPYYYPYFYRPQRPRRNNRQLISILLYLTSLLGMVFWITFVFVTWVQDPNGLEFSNAGETMWFGFTVLMLVSSLFCAYGGYAASKGNYEVTITASAFGIISFGYLMGSILAFVCLAMAFSSSQDFPEQNEEGR